MSKNPTTNIGKDKLNLRKGELQRLNGTFAYQWSDESGKRHSVYAKTLAELRGKEQTVLKCVYSNIKPEARSKTVNDVYKRWKDLKRGLKDNTFQNYQ